MYIEGWLRDGDGGDNDNDNNEWKIVANIVEL